MAEGFPRVANATSGPIQAPQPSNIPIDGAAATVNGTSAASTATVGKTLFRVMSTVNAHIAIGSAPTADSDSPPIVAYVPEWFSCLDGDKVAYIKEAGQSDGTIYIHPAVE